MLGETLFHIPVHSGNLSPHKHVQFRYTNGRISPVMRAACSLHSLNLGHLSADSHKALERFLSPIANYSSPGSLIFPPRISSNSCLLLVLFSPLLRFFLALSVPHVSLLSVFFYNEKKNYFLLHLLHPLNLPHFISPPVRSCIRPLSSLTIRPPTPLHLSRAGFIRCFSAAVTLDAIAKDRYPLGALSANALTPLHHCKI